MGRFDGKVVIVTGAGHGIGRAHALAFAAEGAQVVVNDLGSDRQGGGKTSEAADIVVAEISRHGQKAVANYDTVSTREGADSILWTAISKFGRADILINNAGVLRDRSFLNMSESDWDKVLEVHLDGAFYCSQAMGRHLKAQGQGGRIINTTSVSGLLGNFGQANYAAAKAGIYGLTRTLAIEFAKFGVTVNALAPVALTRMTQDLPAFKGLTESDMGPQFVAPLALFLASDAAAAITGQVVGIAGPKVFLFAMTQTEGATKSEGNGVWTVDELAENWTKISG